MPRFRLVQDVDLAGDHDYGADCHLGQFGANSLRTGLLLEELGRNEVAFVRGKTPGRARLVINFMGIEGVMLVRLPAGAKYSIGIALREALRKIAVTKAQARMLKEEALAYRTKLK